MNVKVYLTVVITVSQEVLEVEIMKETSVSFNANNTKPGIAYSQIIRRKQLQH